MQFIPPKCLLELGVTEKLGPLTNTKAASQHQVVMTDGYSKLKNAIWMPRVTASFVAIVVLQHCMISCKIFITKITENGSQFLLKFLSLLYESRCANIVKKITRNFQHNVNVQWSAVCFKMLQVAFRVFWHQAVYALLSPQGTTPHIDCKNQRNIHFLSIGRVIHARTHPEANAAI